MAEPFDDRETEAQPVAAGTVQCRDLVKFAEDAAPLIFRNADTGIAHLDAQPISRAPAAQHDPAGARIADRVGNKIEQNALKQDRVAAHPRAR